MTGFLEMEESNACTGVLDMHAPSRTFQKRFRTIGLRIFDELRSFLELLLKLFN